MRSFSTSFAAAATFSFSTAATTSLTTSAPTSATVSISGKISRKDIDDGGWWRK